MTNNIIFRKVHEDKRGGVAQIEFHNKSYELFEVVKGAIRGGHSHTADSTLILLFGKIEYREVEPGRPATEKKMILQHGDRHDIRAGCPHLVVGIENSLALEFRHEGKFENTRYPPYRKLVEDYLSSES